ncbi:MAG TPA: DUF441 domain-containing protein [Methylomusa anaerophila]|uniref:UPF0756 membrane protein MAMMFC1_00519 n=1 Tax=Methylomusa anaerophila TaxID=1930071 RepID=A0A348AFN1_9FIRM|nr:DUF441 domain-containing protein [Methylomusa anaerophila]BBB89879.1 hypothetical protein MAMMFC1_00519 [Methylomusa anaerophila]HML89074.1 DUF441 domain-containing protein [Methylomusa anaerophila]
MNWDNIPLLIILALSMIGNNHTVSVSALVLLLIPKLGLENCFQFIDKQGINIGIIILTIAVLSPVAQGRIAMNEVLDVFKAPVGLLAVVIGIFLAWVAGQGVVFMKESPETVTALVVGTIIGVCFFRGLPVGPLIAGGLVALVVNALGLFKG